MCVNNSEGKSEERGQGMEDGWIEEGGEERRGTGKTGVEGFVT